MLIIAIAYATATIAIVPVDEPRFQMARSGSRPNTQQQQQQQRKKYTR